MCDKNMTVNSEEEDETQLHIAARLNDIELVRAALSEGFDANTVGVCGWTAVHEASSAGNSAVLRVLLRSGGDPNVQDRLHKCTSLHLAARNGHLDAVRLLVRNGARLDLKNAERRTAQEIAQDDCKEYLDRKRLEGVFRASGFQSGEQTVQKLYRKPSEGPILRQSTPVSGSRDCVMSSSSGESLTSSGSAESSCRQDPYDIGLSFDFNKQYLSLKIHIGHVKNLKLPSGHNYSHLYVKSYLVPSTSPSATKRKTSQLKIESDGRLSSSSSSGTESIDSTDSGIGLEEKMTRLVMSSLKKRPHLNPKKKKRNKDKVKCMVQQDPVEGVCRISAVFAEDLTYDTVALSKINLSVCEIVITVCGRNSWTSSGQPIVSVRIPLSSAAEQVTHNGFPVKYHATETLSRKNTPVELSQSCEKPRVGRRHLGWSAPDLFHSMAKPAPESPSEKDQSFSYMASTNDIGKKSKKHRPLKFLKSELRFPKGFSRKKSTSASLNDSSSADWNRSFLSSPNTTTASPTRRKQTERGCSDEVTAFHIPEPSMADRSRDSGTEDEVTQPHYLRYSRAFQEHSSKHVQEHSSKRVNSDAICVEDLDDTQSPYSASYEQTQSTCRVK